MATLDLCFSCGVFSIVIKGNCGDKDGSVQLSKLFRFILCSSRVAFGSVQMMLGVAESF
jgi:hypothetical protein